MAKANRRTFLKQTGAGLASTATLASTAALSLTTSASAAGANMKVVMGLIGCGGRGKGVAKALASLPGVEFAYVCDPDANRAAEAANDHSAGNPKKISDLRRLLDDKTVDAVLIATPDHWHTPAAILACEAGKHVYVEKPCSHNIREGRLLVETARRTKRQVQHGTQSRTTPLIRHGIQLLRDGIIGDVLVSKAWNVQRRDNIGHASPGPVPAGVDYDTWIGPAPFVPFQKNRFHYTWHWWYDFGTGDMGNDGVHEIDIARWGLGVETHPSYVSAAGGKYFFKDDQQFPDTQYVSFEYPSNGRTRQLVFEQRLWSPYGFDRIDNGNAFYGTKGWMLLSKRGVLKVFNERHEPVEIDTNVSGESHQANFIAAVRGEQPVNAPIDVGHLSASLCHLGNIATRLGRSLRFEPTSERFIGDDEANTRVGRIYRDDHWGTPKQT